MNATLTRLPKDPPHTRGGTFEVVLPTDVLSHAGNVIASAGRYEAREDADGPEGSVTIWSTDHYAAPNGIWVGLPAHDWTFPGERQRPIPSHDCADHLRSAIAGDDIYCAVCDKVMA